MQSTNGGVFNGDKSSKWWQWYLNGGVNGGESRKGVSPLYGWRDVTNDKWWYFDWWYPDWWSEIEKIASLGEYAGWCHLSTFCRADGFQQDGLYPGRILWTGDAMGHPRRSIYQNTGWFWQWKQAYRHKGGCLNVSPCASQCVWTVNSAKSTSWRQVNWFTSAKRRKSSVVQNAIFTTWSNRGCWEQLSSVSGGLGSPKNPSGISLGGQQQQRQNDDDDDPPFTGCLPVDCLTYQVAWLLPSCKRHDTQHRYPAHLRTINATN